MRTKIKILLVVLVLILTLTLIPSLKIKAYSMTSLDDSYSNVSEITPGSLYYGSLTQKVIINSNDLYINSNISIGHIRDYNGSARSRIVFYDSTSPDTLKGEVYLGDILGANDNQVLSGAALIDISQLSFYTPGDTYTISYAIFFTSISLAVAQTSIIDGFDMYIYVPSIFDVYDQAIKDSYYYYGYDEGYEDAYDDGFEDGRNAYGYYDSITQQWISAVNYGSEQYNLGENQASSNAIALKGFIPAILGTVFAFFFQVASIGVLGISILDIIGALFGIVILLFVIKMLLGK